MVLVIFNLYVLGIIFLVSGIGKAIDSYEFSQLIVQYGFEYFRYLAPLIILFEIIAGLLLFLGARLKLTSLLSLCFVAALTLAYGYGYFFADVAECGCFGHFSILNMSAFPTFARNFAMIGALLFIFLNTDGGSKLEDRSEIIVMACVFSAVCFITGYTFVEHQSDVTRYIVKGKNINEAIENTVLGEFLSPSADSTYFVFLFSYQCPHCFNSIENLKQYERLGVADRVIALSFFTDSATMDRFNYLFAPNFEIKNHPPEQLFRLSNSFPVSYYIKNKTVQMEIRGLLPSGYLLRNELSALKNTYK